MTPKAAYQIYLQSDHWRALRLEAFRVYGRKCFKCPARFGLDVHHLVYRFPWSLGVVADVRPCCRACHEKEHGIVRVVSEQEKLTTQKQARKMRKKFQNRFRKKHRRKQRSKAKIYRYTKPFSKRPRWSQRGNSSN